MAQHRKVKTIPATLTRFTATPLSVQKKRKVAGYARVSTDHDDQFTSYEAQIDYYNCEYDKYNNAVDSFNAVYEDYRNYYNRTHMPKGKKFKFF